MQRFPSSGKNSVARSIALSLVFSMFFVAVSVSAATTISTNISTGGTLSVTGASTLTGLTTMVYGSSTAQSLTGNIQIDGGMTVGSAVANPLAGTILLQARASDPTGSTQGTFYYNSTNKTLKMYDGSNWFTVGTTTSGISLSGARLQLSDLATQYLTIGTTTAGTGQSLTTLEATTTTSVPLALVAYTDQTGHLLDVFSSSKRGLLYVSSNGGLFGSSTAAFGGTLTVGGVLTATTSAYLATTEGTVGVATTTPGARFAVHGGSGYIGNNLFVGGVITSTSTAASTIPYATTTAITVSGTASTTALIVGGNSANGTLSGVVIGTCSIAQEAIAATSTKGVACTGATGLGTDLTWKVFVSATTSLAASATQSTNQGGGFTINGASTTAANVIGIQLTNLVGASATPAGTLNFWAVR